MKYLHLLTIAISLVSCTNEIDNIDALDIKKLGKEDVYLSSKFGPEEETELQMKNSGLSMNERELLDIDKSLLSLEDFFEVDNKFPVYPQDLRSFKLVSYKEMFKDSSSIHIGADLLLCYVDSLLNDEIDYKIYRRMWNYQGSPISTISLYSENDELIYDNIQFNLITPHQISREGNRRLMLSRSENPCYGNQTGAIFAEFNDNYNHQLAYANLFWEEFGRSREGVPLYQGSSMYAILYHYSHERLVVNSYTHTEFGYTDEIVAKAQYDDMSTNDAGRLKYFVWVGPKKQYEEDYQSDLESRIHYPFVGEEYILFGTHVRDTTSCYDGCFMESYYGAWEYTEPEEIQYL